MRDRLAWARSNLAWILLGGGVLALGLGLSGVGYVSHLEQNNSFCASCHTQPEFEYYQRLIDSQQPTTDLATFHLRHEEAVKCIDCHGGEGLAGRAQVLAKSAWDALKFLVGVHRQPAMMSIRLPDQACSKCHQDVYYQPGFENHFHNEIPNSMQTFRCLDCHLAHPLGDPTISFGTRDVFFPECVRCHQEMGGPLQLR